ncbi:MAG: BamA/TamA family outer membrane protein [Aquabacterium sp.]|uniref:autotransporter assembly complex protein TamA n=1 Tax=Aquabacterium sp. TaxID=1872578 RepID=UPI002728350A|nr:BamA/TamA family outer membrane protein [Aquabacterium sp.]MDO9003052.1 BamA/TamA family outer membrane protein [Aquabacterium sp.]
MTVRFLVLTCAAWGLMPSMAWAQDTAASPPEAAASVAQAPRAARRPPLVWKLDIEAPGALDDLLSNYLDLARYHEEATAEGDNTGIAIRRSELRRLVAAAPDQARSLLEAQGYFAAQIHTSVSDEVEGQPLLIKLVVEPGPRTRVSRVQMVFEGNLDTALSKDEAHAKALVADLESEWALPAGTIFTQPNWSAAKNGMLARMRAEGYPLATWSGTSATVDAQNRTAALFVVADSGPIFHFGDIYIEGLKAQPASAILNLAPFAKGEVYREQSLLDFQERVQKLNLFDSVFINMAQDQSQADGAPVTVQVHELPLQQATVGVGVSSDTGPRISVEHLHRNLLKQEWQAKTKLQLAKIDSSLQVDLISHPQPGRKRWLVSGQLAKETDTSDAVTTSERLRFGQLREGERLEMTRYVEYQSARVKSKAGEQVSDASAISGTLQYAWRDVDSQTLPTTGITALTSVGLGHSFATRESSGPFNRLYGRLTWYRPLPWGWDATTRIEGGRLLSRESVSIPDPLLFRAGGDESVRGYGYRSIGVTRDGALVGGRAMTTLSAEVAHPFLKKYPSILGAVFIDAGGVADQFADIKLQRGYGAGIRWRSPVGPLKIDLAYGEQTQSFRIHFSVGITL